MIDRNAFSLTAAVRAAQNELAEHRRIHLLRAAVLPALMFVVSLYIMWLNNAGFEAIANIFLFGYIFCFALFMTISASLSFEALISKERRLLFYMTPLRQSEKFVGQLLVFQLLYPLYYVVMALAVVAILFGGALVMPGSAYTLPDFLHLGKSWVVGMWYDIPAGIIPAALSLVYAGASFYIAGAVYFRRHSFLKTTITIWVVGTVIQFGVFFVTLGSIAFNGLFDSSWTMSPIAIACIPWAILLQSLVIIGFNWYMAYYRMCESGIE